MAGTEPVLSQSSLYSCVHLSSSPNGKTNLSTTVESAHERTSTKRHWYRPTRRSATMSAPFKRLQHLSQKKGKRPKGETK